jgi:hypothetical protein
MSSVRLLLVPLSVREANDFVESFHRHNGRTTRDSGKFAIGCSTGDELVGAAIVGRPLSRHLDDGWTAEVLRCCTSSAAPKGACSFLYGACWHAWRAMGGKRIVTYTLASESGASLRGAGWRIVAQCRAGDWSRPQLGRMRAWQPIYGQQKFRWEMASGG